MFGLGFGEILLLAAIGLMVLGPKQMPQVARVLGKTIGELRKALREVTTSLALEDEEKHKPINNPTATTPYTPPPANPPVASASLNSVPVPHQTHDPVPVKKEES